MSERYQNHDHFAMLIILPRKIISVLLLILFDLGAI